MSARGWLWLSLGVALAGCQDEAGSLPDGAIDLAPGGYSLGFGLSPGEAYHLNHDGRLEELYGPVFGETECAGYLTDAEFAEVSARLRDAEIATIDLPHCYEDGTSATWRLEVGDYVHEARLELLSAECIPSEWLPSGCALAAATYAPVGRICGNEEPPELRSLCGR